MNIFATHQDPKFSAKVLPDKHIVKMPLESCQMLAIIYSKWYYDWGTLPKADGTPYATKKGAFQGIIHQPNGQDRPSTILLG